MNNETDISLKFTNKVTNVDKLERYAKSLETIKKSLSKIPKNTDFSTNLLADYSNKFDKIIEQLDTIDKRRKKALENQDKAFAVAKLMSYLYALKKISTTMMTFVDKSSDYLENINLYQVAFNGAYQEADRFVNKITEMYGLDESWAVRTVGVFRQLANAMGLAVEQANDLSYLMTQMSIDISSLYNVDIDRASQILQSALAGQTRPIRSVTGADITQNTLQQTLNELGIDRAISQLSFAEKRLIIIVSLTRQLQQSVNDFGRTINCGIMLKNIVKNFVNLCKKGVNIIVEIIFANDKDLLAI